MDSTHPECLSLKVDSCIVTRPMVGRVFFFLQHATYEPAFQAASMGITAAAMGDEVYFVFAFDALRALVRGSFRPAAHREGVVGECEGGGAGGSDPGAHARGGAGAGGEAGGVRHHGKNLWIRAGRAEGDAGRGDGTGVAVEADVRCTHPCPLGRRCIAAGRGRAGEGILGALSGPDPGERGANPRVFPRSDSIPMRAKLTLLRALVLGTVGGVLATGCQTYDFEPVEPLAVSQTTETRSIEARARKPNLMLLVDTSGSMTDPANKSLIRTAAVQANGRRSCGDSTSVQHRHVPHALERAADGDAGLPRRAAAPSRVSGSPPTRATTPVARTSAH